MLTEIQCRTPRVLGTRDSLTNVSYDYGEEGDGEGVGN